MKKKQPKFTSDLQTDLPQSFNIISRERRIIYTLKISVEDQKCIIFIKEKSRPNFYPVCYKGSFTLESLVQLNHKFQYFEKVEEFSNEMKLISQEEGIKLFIERSKALLVFSFQDEVIQLKVPKILEPSPDKCIQKLIEKVIKIQTSVIGGIQDAREILSKYENIIPEGVDFLIFFKYTKISSKRVDTVFDGIKKFEDKIENGRKKILLISDKINEVKSVCEHLETRSYYKEKKIDFLLLKDLVNKIQLDIKEMITLQKTALEMLYSKCAYDFDLLNLDESREISIRISEFNFKKDEVLDNQRSKILCHTESIIEIANSIKDLFYSDQTIKKMQKIKEYKAPKEVVSACILKDGRLALCLNEENDIQIYNTNLKRDMFLKAHRRSVSSLITLRSGILASCSRDGVIKFWEIKGKYYDCVGTITNAEDLLKIVEISKDRICSISLGFEVKVWESSASLTFLRSLERFNESVDLFEMSSQKYLITSTSFEIKCWNSSTYELVKTFILTEYHCCEFDCDRICFWSSSNIQIINIATFQYETFFSFDSSPNLSEEITSRLILINRYLFFTDSKKQLFCFEKETLDPVDKKKVDGWSTISIFLPIGETTFACVSDSRKIQIWKL